MPQWFSDFLTWFKQLPEYALLHLWKLLLQGLASVIEAIPVPDFFAQASANFSAIPAAFLYFFNFMQADFGIPIVLGAYVLRFALRRIPFIGG